jgi:ATP-dependent Lon protease
VTGIREKVLAAQRDGVTMVFFLKQNEVDIVNLEKQVKAGSEIVLAEAIEPLLYQVLLKK